MITAEEILESARALTLDERLELSIRMGEEAAEERGDQVDGAQRSEILQVLSERVKGPFEPFPGKEQYMNRIMEQVPELRDAQGEV